MESLSPKKPKTVKEWLTFTESSESEKVKEATLVSELIEDGYLRGVTRTDANGDPADFQIRGITLKGRNLLRDLIKEEKQREFEELADAKRKELNDRREALQAKREEMLNSLKAEVGGNLGDDSDEEDEED